MQEKDTRKMHKNAQECPAFARVRQNSQRQAAGAVPLHQEIGHSAACGMRRRTVKTTALKRQNNGVETAKQRRCFQ